MPKEKGKKSEAEDEKGKPKWTRVCKICVAQGVPVEKATFHNFGVFGQHSEAHKVAGETVNNPTGGISEEVEADMDESNAAEIAAEEKQAANFVAKKKSLREDVMTAPPDEMDALREILKNAGVFVRRESVVTAFEAANPDDLKQLDELLNEATVPHAARRMVLRNWAIHRGIPMGYIDVKYPKVSVTAVDAEEEQEKVAQEKKEKEKAKVDPIDDMIESMGKQMKLMTMQMQMQGLQQMILQGKTATPPGMPATTEAKEEPKLRILENGQTVEMTESKWADYVIAQQRWKEQVAFNASKEEKKKETEKIPFRLEDGTIVQVPSDQVDKWLFMMKSTAPAENKKDVFEIMREQDKTRQEMERFYQQQMSQLKDQNYQMMAERQEQAIRQLQGSLQNRPNPIQEMVQTQEELKSAGLLAQNEGKGLDQHKLEMQEKKLDTTMQLVVQQQASLNRKTDQLIAALGPIAQQYAAKAADNLPQPQEARENFHQRRANIAKEVLPVDESALQRIQDQLEPQEEERPRPRKAMTVGMHDQQE